MRLLISHDRAMKCIGCEDTGWVCDNHPDQPWEGHHLANAAAPGCPALNAIRPTKTSRRGYRKALNLMLKARLRAHAFLTISKARDPNDESVGIANLISPNLPQRPETRRREQQQHRQCRSGSSGLPPVGLGRCTARRAGDPANDPYEHRDYDRGHQRKKPKPARHSLARCTGHSVD
jgi:hypothetical protein